MGGGKKGGSQAAALERGMNSIGLTSGMPAADTARGSPGGSAQAQRDAYQQWQAGAPTPVGSAASAAATAPAAGVAAAAAAPAPSVAKHMLPAMSMASAATAKGMAPGFETYIPRMEMPSSGALGTPSRPAAAQSLWAPSLGPMSTLQGPPQRPATGTSASCAHSSTSTANTSKAPPKATPKGMPAAASATGASAGAGDAAAAAQPVQQQDGSQLTPRLVPREQLWKCSGGQLACGYGANFPEDAVCWRCERPRNQTKAEDKRIAEYRDLEVQQGRYPLGYGDAPAVVWVSGKDLHWRQDGTCPPMKIRKLPAGAYKGMNSASNAAAAAGQTGVSTAATAAPGHPAGGTAPVPTVD